MADVPSKLGEFILRGWVLTDNPCPGSSCRGVPLLRSSPKDQTLVVHHCVSCDRNPFVLGVDGAQSQSSSTISSMSPGSRPSTPPTEISSNLSSPTFAPRAETEEMRRRREQSDQASTEIGKRMLKGWAMLGEECPRPRCYGVPLVRPPKTNGDKDPRKECVACGTVYLSEGDSEGWQRLIPISSTTSPWGEIPGKSPQPIQLPTLDPTPPTNLTVGIPTLVAPELRDIHSLIPVSRNVTLDAPTQALELALGVLSERLKMTCANLNLLDPGSVAESAEAIGKVAHALAQVNHLRQYNILQSSSKS